MGTMQSSTANRHAGIFPGELRKSGMDQIDWRYVGYGFMGYIMLATFVITFSSFDPFIVDQVPDFIKNLPPRIDHTSSLEERSAKLDIPTWLLNGAGTGTTITTNSSTPAVAASNVTDNVSSDSPDRVRRVPRGNRGTGEGRSGAINNLKDTMRGTFAGLSVDNGNGQSGSFSGNHDGTLAEKFQSVEGISRDGSGVNSTDVKTNAGDLSSDITRSNRSGNTGRALSSTDEGVAGGLTIGSATSFGDENFNNEVVIAQDTVSQGTNAGSGTRADVDILGTVRTNSSQLKNKYIQVLKLHPQLQGVLTVKLTIQSSGRVSDIELVRETLNDRRFVRTIMALIRGWRFGRSDGGTTTTVLTLPFSPR